MSRLAEDSVLTVLESTSMVPGRCRLQLPTFPNTASSPHALLNPIQSRIDPPRAATNLPSLGSLVVERMQGIVSTGAAREM